MKKRINLSVLLLSVLLTFLTSCVQNLFPDSSYASIAVNLPGNSSARTAIDKSSLSYKLKCETEYGELISEKNGISGETVTFGELEQAVMLFLQRLILMMLHFILAVFQPVFLPGNLKM